METPEIVEVGASGVCQGFGVIMEEFFKPDPAGTIMQNPFAQLGKPVQLAIIQKALIVSLAQTIATTAKLAGVTNHQMLQVVLGNLKDYVLEYSAKLEKDLKDDKDTVGKGSKAGDKADGIISGS